MDRHPEVGNLTRKKKGVGLERSSTVPYCVIMPGDRASAGVRWTLLEADSGVEVVPFLSSCGTRTLVIAKTV